MHQVDILVIATPIWPAHPSGLCEWVLEWLNAESSQTDGQGCPLLYGKAAAVAVAGNEDGAHKVSADISQALNDVGVSIAPGAVMYWVGQTQQGTDCQDLDERPQAVADTTRTLAVDTVHLAKLLKEQPCPAG
ncbi:NAD(P)H-dependent oxidoreductase [Streptomyces sp. NPDC058293]|uniref:NAD(P)H-dependent oxidoreductase n=1 Tax=Streptomyces sp. NPDC058293 TaxID=3346429 RepID=UPI0036F08B59